MLLVLAAHWTVYCEPGTIALVSLIVSVALTAASVGLQLLLSPKPKAQPKQRLNDISFSDSAWGTPVYRIYGKRGNDNYGGIEIGGNVIWASDIRKTETQVQGTAGGSQGGKGGSRSSSNQVETNYKIDFAVALGEGRLRLLRVKLNEDVVFENLHSLQSEPSGTKYEAEAGTRTGTATIISEGSFSSGQRVGNLDSTGTLTMSLTGGSSLECPIHIGYKSSADVTCEVQLGGQTITYTFPATGSERRWRTLYKILPAGTENIKLQNASSNALKIDAVIVEPVFEDSYLEDLNNRQTGIYDEEISSPSAQDNYIFPEKDYRYLENVNRANIPIMKIQMARFLPLLPMARN